MNKLTVSLILLVGCLFSLWIMHLLFDRIILKRKNKIHVKFLKNVLNALIITVFIYAFLHQFDETRDIGNTIFRGGTLIIAVLSFAAQQPLSNIISGFSLSGSKPFEVGEKVKLLQGNSIIAEGIVKDITLRHVVIQQYDGQSYLVPNNIVNNSVVVNTNYSDNVGNFMEVEISYESDIDKAIDIFTNVCAQNSLLISKEKLSVSVSRMTANGVVLKTTIWTRNLDDNFRACSDIRKELLKQFKENGIQIPYTTITIK